MKNILNFYDNRKDLIDAEKKLINTEALNDVLCLNLTFGGQGGKVYESTPEINKKKSNSLKGRYNWWGYKVSNSLKCKTQPKERIERAANSRRGNKNGSWINCDIDEIIILYIDNKKSIREISKQLNIGRKVITSRILKAGYILRSSNEQIKINKSKNT